MLGKGDAPDPPAMPSQNGYFLVNFRMPKTS